MVQKLFKTRNTSSKKSDLIMVDLLYEEPTTRFGKYSAYIYIIRGIFYFIFLLYTVHTISYFYLFSIFYKFLFSIGFIAIAFVVYLIHELTRGTILRSMPIKVFENGLLMPSTFFEQRVFGKHRFIPSENIDQIYYINGFEDFYLSSRKIVLRTKDGHKYEKSYGNPTHYNKNWIKGMTSTLDFIKKMYENIYSEYGFVSGLTEKEIKDAVGWSFLLHSKKRKLLICIPAFILYIEALLLSGAYGLGRAMFCALLVILLYLIYFIILAEIYRFSEYKIKCLQKYEQETGKKIIPNDLRYSVAKIKKI